MILDLLFHKLPKLKPETKWLLILLVCRFVDDQRIEVDASKLSQELHVPKKAIYKSLMELSQLGLFDKYQIFLPDKKYLNAYGFSFSRFNDLKGILGIDKNDSFKQPLTYHGKKILTFMQNQPCDESFLKLKSPSKLLVFTLLLFADKTGVVNNLNKKDLCKLTGMSMSRIDAHIKKLMELGYIRSKVDGVKDDNIFGYTPDVFYLDLCHQSFGDEVILRDTVIIKSLIKEDNDYLELDIISKVVNKIIQVDLKVKDAVLRKSKKPFIFSHPLPPPSSDVIEDIILYKVSKEFDILPCYCRYTGYKSYKKGVWFAGYGGYPDFCIIKDLFIDGFSKGISVFFQYTVEKYASMLLTASWNDLGKVGQIKNDHVSNLIKREIIPNRIKAKGDPDCILSEIKIDKMHDFIFCVSVGLAQWVQCLLSRTDINSFDKCIMLKSKLVREPILSSDKKLKEIRVMRVLVVELYSHCDSTKKQGKVFEFIKPVALHKKNHSEIVRFRQRKGLSKDEKFKYGLLTTT